MVSPLPAVTVMAPPLPPFAVLTVPVLVRLAPAPTEAPVVVMLPPVELRVMTPPSVVIVSALDPKVMPEDR